MYQASARTESEGIASRRGEVSHPQYRQSPGNKAQQRHDDSGDEPRHGAQGVMVGRGVREACTEETLEPDPGVLDRGRITRRQLVQDSQRSSDRDRLLGVLETLAGGL